jgi:hypothetical protein
LDAVAVEPAAAWAAAASDEPTAAFAAGPSGPTAAARTAAAPAAVARIAALPAEAAWDIATDLASAAAGSAAFAGGETGVASPCGEAEDEPATVVPGEAAASGPACGVFKLSDVAVGLRAALIAAAARTSVSRARAAAVSATQAPTADASKIGRFVGCGVVRRRP